ncbi:MAG: hypothetical protein EHM56_00105 [Chloroflexi bacterium]|nr:MAG: hypothetical protein EHM56_00105 [Chloroflexota bacterium]
MDLQFPAVASERDIVLTMGVFDGVHLGHRQLVRQVIRRARERGCLGGAITFHPHPRAVLAGDGPPCLVTLDERLALLAGLGLDVVAALPFTRELARLSAPDFMGLLCRHLRLRELWVGSDFALGHRREGTTTRLAEIGCELGYQVHVVPPLVHEGQTVSSTLIRSLVQQGHVEAAARLLQRRHCVGGIAGPEERQDRGPGLSTASVAVSDGVALPAGGVYATYATWRARQWPTTAHVKPGSAGTGRLLEIHVPRRAEDLVGQPLRVEFVRHL